ncbi:hypothetical protein AGMMS49992_10590 [Clostridia bacterium]|nr:hypothetical protein AGMMS49992_10590 [Clostridia bacterium]
MVLFQAPGRLIDVDTGKHIEDILTSLGAGYKLSTIMGWLMRGINADGAAHVASPHRVAGNYFGELLKCCKIANNYLVVAEKARIIKGKKMGVLFEK